MTALASYSTGTVSVSAAGTIVTGVGTIWSGVNVRPGDILQIGNFQSVITDVTDTTDLVIPPWGGGNQSGVAYKIWQVSPQRFAGAQAMADVSTLIAAINTSGFIWFVAATASVPDPSYGSDGQWAYQPNTGLWWLKTGGAWVSSGAPVKGYGGTSSTSIAIGTGSKAFTTQANLAYQVGTRARAAVSTDPTKWMEGVVTAYTGTSMTINVDKTGGSGTFTSWNFSVAGQFGNMDGANNLSEVASPTTSRLNLGINQMTVVAGTPDLNTIVATGTYQVFTTTNTPSMTGSSDWYLEVLAHSNTGYVVQRAISLANADVVFVRRKIAATWEAWKEVAYGSAGHYPGTGTNDAAAAGEIGENQTATLSASLTSSGVAVSAGNITLGPGDWEISATVVWQAMTGATQGTDWYSIISTISTPSIANGNSITGSNVHDRRPAANDYALVQPQMPFRVSISSTTTYYLHGSCTFTGGTGFAIQGVMKARRAR